MNIASLCRLPLFGLAVLLILSGCAGQRIGSPELVPSRYADRVAAELTPAEQRAFDTTGTLDRSLDPSMERMVRYHFVKYSRDRRTTMEAFLRNGLPYQMHHLLQITLYPPLLFLLRNTLLYSEEQNQEQPSLRPFQMLLSLSPNQFLF